MNSRASTGNTSRLAVVRYGMLPASNSVPADRMALSLGPRALAKATRPVAAAAGASG